MQRRRFVQNLAFLTGGFVLNGLIPAKALMKAGLRIKGMVSCKGKGLAGVVVSDGYNVLATDKNGEYSFNLHSDATTVFISTPAGYEFIHQNGLARHYKLVTAIDKDSETNFELTPLTIDDNEHRFVIWADPQVKNEKDVEKMMAQSVPDTKKVIAAAAAAGQLIHGITVGDIVWDELPLFAAYDKAVAEMEIPFFQCIGNHDMDYRKGGDETSDDTFTQTYGPATYSFNRGQVHYVVMDNVRYLGTERDYDGWFQKHLLNWLKKDLSFVPADKTIVLCVHIPVHMGTKNREELYEILEGRNVHIMSGHTHWHENNIRGNIYEHNHGTVCGAWWTGPICGDGTPSGYGVYQVKGKEICWHYQATGHEADYQMKIHVNPFDERNRQAVVNIWNWDAAWKNEYFLDGISKGSLEQFSGFDPVAYTAMLGPDLPKQRGFAEPKQTNHLFKALIPVSAKELKVVATDRFGKQYNASYRFSA